MICLDRGYKKRSGIYLIICSGNSKVYVGSSVNLYKRLLEHARLLRGGKHHCLYLQRSYDKYGSESFRGEVLLECPEIELESQEKKIVKEYYDIGLTMNSTLDYRGSHGMVFTEERKRKISESNMGRIAHNKGVAMSKEQKEGLIRAHVKRIGKEIDVYDLMGNLIKTVKGIKLFAREHGIDQRSAQRALNGQIDSTTGYILRYRGHPFERERNRPLTEYQLRIGCHRKEVWDRIYQNKFSTIKQVSVEMGCSDTLVETAVIDYLAWFVVLHPQLDRIFAQSTQTSCS